MELLQPFVAMAGLVMFQPLALELLHPFVAMAGLLMFQPLALELLQPMALELLQQLEPLQILE